VILGGGFTYTATFAGSARPASCTPTSAKVTVTKTQK
jgi:hypothetical protein